MVAEKFIRIAKGLIKAVIPIPRLHRPSPTGGTTDSRYCYSTWLRHLILLNESEKNMPAVIAELGPGDSLGTGLAALLCGCKKYMALDLFAYGNAAHNVKIFDELVELFSKRAAVPDAVEYPGLIPYLDNYQFPAHIITEELLAASMAPERLAAIRKELASPAASNTFINYFVPWQADDIKNETVDLVFSQSVLQYTDLDMIYPVMNTWLKPGGLMAHAIDFSSLGSSKLWNGHRAYSSFEWKLFRIGKKMPLNRSYPALHKTYLKKNNFNLLNFIPYKKEGGLFTNQFTKEFRHLPNDDAATHAAYMLSAKLK
ncbi:MAG: hypothetical protein ABIR78_00155 [Ferruginibacter sp.]